MNRKKFKGSRTTKSGTTFGILCNKTLTYFLNFLLQRMNALFAGYGTSFEETLKQNTQHNSSKDCIYQYYADWVHRLSSFSKYIARVVIGDWKIQRKGEFQNGLLPQIWSPWDEGLKTYMRTTMKLRSVSLLKRYIVPLNFIWSLCFEFLWPGTWETVKTYNIGWVSNRPHHISKNKVPYNTEGVRSSGYLILSDWPYKIQI